MNEYQLKNLKSEIEHSLDKTFETLADEYCVEESFVNSLNNGEIFADLDKNYPLRTQNIDNFDEIVAKIKEDLRNSSLNMTQISQKYSVSFNFVYKINKGKIYSTEDKYPIKYTKEEYNRCMNPKEVREIEGQLRAYGLSNKEIAQRHHVHVSVILALNFGRIKRYVNEDVRYPIRPRNRENR